MPYQTTVIKPDAVRIGSAKIEVGDSESTLVDLGAARNVVLQEQWERVVISGDNVGKIKEYLKNHIATISFNWLELDLLNIHKLRGGIDTYQTVAGTLVAGAAQVVNSGSWAYNKFVKIENQNGDGSAISVNSVAAGTDGLLAANTDYYVGQNESGQYGIYIIDSTKLTTIGQSLTINYDYTPNASKVLSTGGRSDIDPNIVRLTNTNSDGKKFEVTIYKASNTAGINLTLPSDDADDVWATPVTLEGVCDGTRTVGNQLFKIVDEQSVA